jgi:hypothetical protein
MRRTLLAGAGVLAILSGFAVAATGGDAPATATFVGTTPCGELVRGFVPGLAPGAPCHALTWRLEFIAGPAEGSRWALSAVYGVPSASNPNVMVDGPRATVSGRLTVTDAEYRLASPQGGRTLVFRRVSDGLIHLLGADEALAVGTAGWSYTLSHANQAEKPASPSMAPDMSYTISPRATGQSVFGIFEGRTPCNGIARELGMPSITGCLKVKWRVTLLQNPATAEPTSYKIESSLHRAQARQGSWRILREGAPASGAAVYQLDGTSAEGPLLLLKGDENVLFFLNRQRQLLVGTVDFGYTLNRVTPAESR